jgi:hypothetical protein
MSYGVPQPQEGLQPQSRDCIRGALVNETDFISTCTSAPTSSADDLRRRLVFAEPRPPSVASLRTDEDRKADLVWFVQELRDQLLDLTALDYVARVWTEAGAPTQFMLVQLKTLSSRLDLLHWRTPIRCPRPGAMRYWIEHAVEQANALLGHKREASVLPVCPLHFRRRLHCDEVLFACESGPTCRLSHRDIDLQHLLQWFQWFHAANENAHSAKGPTMQMIAATATTVTVKNLANESFSVEVALSGSVDALKQCIAERATVAASQLQARL